MSAERPALIVSALAAAALGAVGVVAAVVSGSGAILLDGLFNVCFFATALLTLRVAALLERPDDERYPFGYLFFEPLINTAKGLLILGVSLFALVDAAIALASGGREVVLGPAMAYAAFATVTCVAVALFLRAPPRREPAGRRRRGELDGQRRGLRRRPRGLRRRRHPRARRPHRRRPPCRSGDGRTRRPRHHRRAAAHGRRRPPGAAQPRPGRAGRRRHGGPRPRGAGRAADPPALHPRRPARPHRLSSPSTSSCRPTPRSTSLPPTACAAASSPHSPPATARPSSTSSSPPSRTTPPPPPAFRTRRSVER